MEASFTKITSLIIGLGSIFFLIAAFLPVSRVFVEPGAEKKMAIIQEMKGMWNFGHVLFGLGSIVTVVGLGLLILGTKEISRTALSYSSVALLAIGAILWSWHVTERLIDPESFANGANTPYLFLIYSVLTQVGLVLLGFVLMGTFVRNWISWMFIIGAAVLFVLMVIFKDMPPFVYYILTLIMAINLFMINS